MIILGIDPGLVSGAVAIIGDGAVAGVADIPTLGDKAKMRINVHALEEWIRAHNPGHAFVERAGVMPRQGAASGFKYGRAVGAIEAVVMLLHVPLTIIEPSVWKRALGLKGDDKESARALAIQRWPRLAPMLARVKDHNRAEALLLAAHGMRTLAASPGLSASLPCHDPPGIAGP